MSEKDLLDKRSQISSIQLFPMIDCLANKAQFRADILSNGIEEIVHDSFKGVLGKSVGPSELASWKNSLRHMDTVLEDAGISDNAGVKLCQSA